MQRPPEVSFLVSRSLWHARLACLGWLLGVLVVVLFFITQPTQRYPAIALVCISLLTGVVAFTGWFRSHEGMIKWDGDSWHWKNFEGSGACNLTLHLDFQRVMLVCITGHQTPKSWLWLEANPSKPGWRALRRAVVASHGLNQDAGQAIRHN